MNKKISQFEVASKFNSEDIIPIIQDNENSCGITEIYMVI